MKLKKPEQDPALLKEIRENFDIAVRFWDPIHKEGNLDVRFVAGDPWDSRDIEIRERDEQKRPHLVFDMASQYINSLCGKERQRKRGVKVSPEGGASNAETAEKIQGRVYYIENKSKAQSKYIAAFKDAATRGYGWIGVSKKYSSDRGREQEPVIRGFDNPDSVLIDPNVKEYDGSDARFCIVIDRIGKGEFRRRFKKYDPSDLSKNDDTVVLTEYWKVDSEITDRALLLDGPAGQTEVHESELPGRKHDPARDGEILDERDVESKTVKKYICQLASSGASADSEGVEILEIDETTWKSIPIVPVLGEKYYLTDSPNAASAAGSPKVVYLSLIRRARDPMGLLNLGYTNAAEQMAMVPKTRYMGYEGQFEGHEDEFANIGTNPLGYLQVKGIVDPTTNTVLPLPRKEAWEAQIQSTMMLVERCENAIRAAVGQIASPELQKNDSGVAIKRLNDSGDTASFHLPDNFAMSLERVGQLIGEALHDTHDSDREVPIWTPQNQQQVVRINAPHVDAKTGKQVHYDFTCADYGYTISTGPSQQSQAEAIKDWAGTLATSNPQLAANLMDLITEMQNFGPDAQPLIERLKKMLPPQLQDDQQHLDPQAQAELQKGQKMIDLLTQHLNEALEIIKTKRIETEAELERARLDNETKIVVAKIQALAKVGPEVIEAEADAAARDAQAQYEAMAQGADHAQELHVQAMDQQHQANMQDMAQSHQADMATQQQAAAAESAQNQPQEAQQ